MNFSAAKGTYLIERVLISILDYCHNDSKSPSTHRLSLNLTQKQTHLLKPWYACFRLFLIVNHKKECNIIWQKIKHQKEVK